MSIRMSNITVDKWRAFSYNCLRYNDFMQNTVNIRDILRSHKQVLERLKQTKKRVVIVSQDKPQAGLVSLDDLKRLEELDKQQKYQQSTKSMLEVARKVRQILKKNNEHLPADLSTRHDYYHYEEGSD